MKTIFIFLLLCLCGISMQATRPDKSDKIAPRWKNGAFPKNHDNSYYFKVAHGEGRTLSDACESAVLTLVGDLASMHGVSVKGTAIEKIKAESRDHVYTENIEHNYTYNLDFDNFKTAFTQIDIYWEKKMAAYTIAGYCLKWPIMQIRYVFKKSLSQRSMGLVGWRIL